MLQVDNRTTKLCSIWANCFKLYAYKSIQRNDILELIITQRGSLFIRNLQNCLFLFYMIINIVKYNFIVFCLLIRGHPVKTFRDFHDLILAISRKQIKSQLLVLLGDFVEILLFNMNNKKNIDMYAPQLAKSVAHVAWCYNLIEAEIYKYSKQQSN